MSPEQKRKFNTIAGSFFSIGAALFLGMAGYFTFVQAPVKPAPVKLTSIVSKESCSDYLRNMGFTADTGMPQSLKVRGEFNTGLDMTASEYYLDRVSLATTVCQYTLKDFCMGTECSEGSGVFFTLTIPEVKVPEIKPVDKTPKPTPNGPKPVNGNKPA